MKNVQIRVKETTGPILGWPTDCVSIDHCHRITASTGSGDKEIPYYPHTVILFLPGNPGLVGWYVPEFEALVKHYGPGFAARLISYAGHGISDDVTDVEPYVNSTSRDTDIPWTVDGQIDHKIAYMDKFSEEMKQLAADSSCGRSSTGQEGSPPPVPPRLIFIGHSIGCYMIQRMLILRPDILRQARSVIYVTPFIRWNPGDGDLWFRKRLGDFLAGYPEQLINVAKAILQRFVYHRSDEELDQWLQKQADIECGRKLVIDLLRQPRFLRNHYELGTEEIRDVPEVPDVSALRVIGAHCPIVILFANKDQWSPEFHMADLKELQTKGIIPSNIYMTHCPDIKHDYVTRPHMVKRVVTFYRDTMDKFVVVPRQENNNNHKKKNDETNRLKKPPRARL